MQIVDAQVHIWDINTPGRPWPGKPRNPVSFSKDALLSQMIAAGVQRAIIVPPTTWGGDPNALGREAARLHPNRFAVMGLLDIETPASRNAIVNWRRQPGMLGLRFNLKGQNRVMLFEGRADWVWSEAQAADVPIMVLAPHSDMHLIGEIARRHPGLKLIIDHLGVVKGKDEEAFCDLDQLLLLAQLPNVAVKASCLPLFTSDVYPFRRLHSYLRRVYDAFGPERMFWGSDLTRLTCSYHQAVTMFTEEIAWLTAEDKEWIMGRALCEWVNWKTLDS